VVVGSLRRDSFNRQLANAVIALAPPEVFIQVKEGLFGEDGNLANADTRAFLQSWMDRYVAWVKKHAA